jgi:hypothetical protein
LLAHRAVIDYGAKTIVLHRQKGVAVLRAGRRQVRQQHDMHESDASNEADHEARRGGDSAYNSGSSTESRKPISAAAFLRAARQGGRTFVCYVREVPSDSQEQAEPLSAEQADLAARRDRIQTEFRDVFVTELPADRKLRDDVPETIPLEPGTAPVWTHGYRYSPREVDEMQRQIKEGVQNGTVQPSTSPYGAPILFVVKKDGSLRMCVDYRRLNSKTIRNRYPLPRIEDLLDRLNGAQYFTTLDLKSGYHQIVLPPSDVPKTAFTTPFGHYEYKVLPMGLSNAPATFQSVMNKVLQPVLGVCALVYLDDVVIYSKNAEQHEQDVRRVLSILSRAEKLYANAKINPN